MIEKVILVDEKDRPIGLEEKLTAHQKGGQLHRAFSIFIVNSKGGMLLQLRSAKKYHFGGLWTNACCSHPRPGERTVDAAHRKLKQELGFDTDLKEAFSFIYRATDAKSGLTEHEFDHVFLGTFDGRLAPNLEEIDEYRWLSIRELRADITKRPESYAPWFKIALKKLYRYLK